MVLGDLGDHLFTRQRVPDEHHPAGHPGDAVPAVRDGTDGDLETPAGPVRRARFGRLGHRTLPLAANPDTTTPWHSGPATTQPRGDTE